MKATFNLIYEPWIPCIESDGKFTWLGLKETLIRSHELQVVEGNLPIETASIFRLLLAILHRCLGPGSFTDWVAIWQAGQWDQSTLENYLNTWEERFDLFHPELPFYQTHEDRVERAVSIT